MSNARDGLAARCAALIRSDDGSTAVEYGLLSAMIAGAIVIAVTAFGTSLTGTFSYVASALDVAQGASPGAGGPGNQGGGAGYGKGGNGQGNNGGGKGNGGPKGGG